MIVHIENEEQFNEIIASNPTVLVDFFANWCGPCNMLSPVLEEIDEKGETEAVIVKIDTDLEGNQSLNQRFGIRSIPTLILYRNGEMVKSSLGYIPHDKVIAFINE
ncbi:MAG: thioredoxin [Coprobacillus sp.]|nr:thioredoxin [Coprobacillus sp.]